MWCWWWSWSLHRCIHVSFIFCFQCCSSRMIVQCMGCKQVKNNVCDAISSVQVTHFSSHKEGTRNTMPKMLRVLSRNVDFHFTPFYFVKRHKLSRVFSRARFDETAEWTSLNVLLTHSCTVENNVPSMGLMQCTARCWRIATCTSHAKRIINLTINMEYIFGAYTVLHIVLVYIRRRCHNDNRSQSRQCRGAVRGRIEMEVKYGNHIGNIYKLTRNRVNGWHAKQSRGAASLRQGGPSILRSF